MSAILSLHQAIGKITSIEGFADYYLRMCGLYDIQLEAYEYIEDFHIVITGKRRYSEFDSFRRVLNNKMR